MQPPVRMKANAVRLCGTKSGVYARREANAAERNGLRNAA